MKLKNLRGADVIDVKCQVRPCLSIGEDKGSFIVGRGYTSYYKKPELVCMTRHLHGCPQPYPEPIVEELRCCEVPNFAKPGKGRKPKFQTCRTCHQRSSGWVLEQRRLLPILDHVSCQHEKVEQDHDMMEGNLWWCCDCGLYWKSKPNPKQVGQTFRELLDEVYKL